MTGTELNKKFFSNGNAERTLLLLSVFALPLWQILSYACWGLLLLFHIFKRKPWKFNFSIFWSFYLFFLLHLIGVFHSTHAKEALNDLIVKIPLVFCPFILAPLMNEETIGKLKSFFLLGVLAAGLLALLEAIINYSKTGDSSYFYYVNYSTYLHPTFFTIFMNVSLLFTIEKMAERKYQKPSGIYIDGAMITFFLLNIYLASARLSQVTVIISLAFYGFLLFKGKSFLFKSAMVLVVLFISAFFIFSNNRFLQLRDASLDEHNKDLTVEDSSYYNSTRVRVVLLEAGLHVFKNHLLTGTGLANYDEDFKSYLRDNNYHFLARKHTGPHSQYLETAILLGIPGLLMIFYLYIGNIFKFLRRKNHLAAAFIIIFSINGLGEYTWRASGILVFCLVVVMFEKLGISFNQASKDESDLLSKQ